MNNPASTIMSQWRKVQVKVDATETSSNVGNDGRVLGPPITDMRLLAVGPSQSTSKRQRLRSLFRRRLRSHLTSPRPPSPSSPAPATSRVEFGTKIDSLCLFVKGLDNGGESLGFLPLPGGTKRVHLETIPGSHTEEAILVHLLPPSKPPAHLKLGRRKRCEIAAAPAWATLLLCDTPWLDHTWDKHGLCFFSDNVSTAGPSLEKRCVPMTQGCSLRSKPVINLNTHPYHNTIIRNQAIFALGVLFELCLNRSFEVYRKDANISITATNIIDDYSVAESLIDDVFGENGKPYGNAV